VAGERNDQNKKRCYELARIVAAKLVENPLLVEEGRRYLERHVKGDPAQRRYYELWSELLELSPEEIAFQLLADNADGELLRDTRPVFYVPSHMERKAALNQARQSSS
jgi:hypothetical protein